MKLIALNKGKFAKVDDADFDWLNQWKWYAVGGYAMRSVMVCGKKIHVRMHSVLSLALGFSNPDHRNRDRLDNRRKNLRPATKAQQAYNRSKRADNKSGFKGVSWDPERKKWRATIQIDGKHKNLGRFRSSGEAALAYDKAAIENFGEFACLNFPNNATNKKLLTESIKCQRLILARVQPR